MQTKTALDMEIAVYKKLLESEEDRLGIQTGDLSGKFLIKNIKFQNWKHQILRTFARLIETRGSQLHKHCCKNA